MSEPSRNKSHATRSVFLATLLMVGALVGLVPTAGAVVANTHLSVYTGPYFDCLDRQAITTTVCDSSNHSGPYWPTSICPNDPGSPVVKSRSDGNITIRTIRVYMDDPAFAPPSTVTMKDVVFSFPLSTPGTTTTPDLAHSIHWVAINSTASGWTAAEFNGATSSGQSQTLTFTTTTSGGIGYQLSVDFQVAFTVPTNAGGPSPYSYPITVTAFDAANNPGFSETTRTQSFCINVDNTSPGAPTAVTRDTGCDGRIDAMVVTFNEEIDPASVVRDEFTVQVKGAAVPYSILSVDNGLIPQTTPITLNIGQNNNPIVDTQNPTRIVLRLAPGYGFDTGTKPQVIYPATGTTIRHLADLAGNKVAPFTIDSTDGAKPLIVGALTQAGSNLIRLTFSEAVFGSGTGNAVSLTDLNYYDLGAVPNNIQPPGFITTGPTPDTIAAKGTNQTEVTLGGTRTMGAGDAHLTDGDQVDVKPGNLVLQCSGGANGAEYVWPPLPAAGGCTSPIHDTAGLAACPHAVITTSIFVVDAEVNIGTGQLKVKFNGPVSDASDPSVPVKITSFSIVAADGSGQGPGGIIQIRGPYNTPVAPNTDEVVLTLDKAARQTDVDDTPARLHIFCNTIKGTGLDVFVPCADPDNDHQPDVNFVDRLGPSITSAETVDTNRDGFIDGIKIVFSEPVDDNSFCVGPDPTVPQPILCDFKTDATPIPVNQIGPWAVANGSDSTDCAAYNRLHGMIKISGINGPYTLDTDLHPNDRNVTLRFPGPPVNLRATDFVPTLTTNPCVAQGCPANPPALPAQQCPAGDPGTAGIGFIRDLSHPQVSTPPYGQANPSLRICADRSGPASCTTTAPVIDRAPPVILSASTVDTPYWDANGDPGTPTTAVEGNGNIDGYRLTFSEPVKDKLASAGGSFRASEWRVAGHTVGAALGPVGPIEGNGHRVVNIYFDEKGPDTDQTPELTYLGASCFQCGLTDLAGVPMLAIGTADLTEKDGAPPVIVSIQGFIHRDQLVMRFSEPVDNGDHAAVNRGSLTYSNGGTGSCTALGASGMKDQNAVRSTVGSVLATITLDAALGTCDFQYDRMGANPNSVFEISPTVIVKQAISQVAHHITPATDLTPPANITDLKVVPGLTTANSMSVTWTAPGNDGNAFGNVTTYSIEIATSPIVSSQFGQSASPGFVALGTSSPHIDPTTRSCSSVDLGNGMFIDFAPLTCALAQPGHVQQATVKGLLSNKMYYIAVESADNATTKLATGAIMSTPNLSGMSNVVSATTGTDDSPPVGTPVITSTTHPPPLRYTLLRNAIFNWTDVADPQSAVIYHFAFNQQPDYTVTLQDTTATSANRPVHENNIADGKWYFHVAGFSGGGTTRTGHYAVAIGYAPVDANSILDANYHVSESASHTGSGKPSPPAALPFMVLALFAAVLVLRRRRA
jgi:hypothetical protein